MEHNGNISARASTDERARPSPRAPGEQSTHPPGEPRFATEAEAEAWWAGVNHGLRCLGGEDERSSLPGSVGDESPELLDPSGRRLRADGWLPWKKAEFLLVLAGGGIVADACRAVGMSVASAYALKNRRSGRAFGKMWDAILIHRARGRLADSNLSRAMEGCVEQVLKDGVVVAERRRFDNRLSMAMLTRLDRLAESRDGEESELLRALSEDFEDYVELLGSGGDEEAFLAARGPKPAQKKAAPPEQGFRRDLLDDLAALDGTSAWRGVAPPDIPIDDLDPDQMDDWRIDGWIRAIRSHYLDWLEMHRDSGIPWPPGPDCPAAYDRVRRDIVAAMAADEAEAEAALAQEADFNASPGLTGEENPAKGEGGGPHESETAFHKPSAGPPPRHGPERNDSGWQASTSSTSNARRRRRRRKPN